MQKVFISHSSKDKPFVRKLKEDLNFNGIETWVNEDELKVGDKLLDSLMLGLESSTHFIIVLSNNIKGSNWVETEIKEALTAFGKNTLNKIIPVILRKTDIPLELNDLLRADFSSIIFTLKDDKVQYTGDTYNIELGKIVKAINQSNENKLSKSEKSNIILETDKKSTLKDQRNNVVGFYEISGFSSKESKLSYINNLKERYKNNPLNKIVTQEIQPVILPILLKPIFDKLVLGDKILFPVGGPENFEAHFCGFSENNKRIIVPGNIRKAFGISSNAVVLLEINGKEKSIRFID